ncbi:MAG TPA: hypothetical protein VIG24_08095 [Acidimicrobiia bacterium]
MMPTDEELRAHYAGMAMQALVEMADVDSWSMTLRDTAYRISKTSFEIARMMVIVRKETEKEFNR